MGWPTAARSTWWQKSRGRWHIEVGEAQDARLPCPHHCGYTVSVPCIGLRRSEGSRRTHLLSPNKLFCQALQPDNSSRRPKYRLDARAARTYNARGMKSPYLGQSACRTRTAVYVVQVPFRFFLSSSNESM